MKKLLVFTALMLAAVFVQAQWTSQYTGNTNPYRGANYIHAVDANTVWLNFYDGASTLSSPAPLQEYGKTTNGGTTWTAGAITNAANLYPSMIWGIDANKAFCIMYNASTGTTGKVMVTTDGGTTWAASLPNATLTTAFQNTSAAFPDVCVFFNANDGMAMGDPVSSEYEIYTTADGGTTWTAVPGANIPNPASGSEYGYTGVYSVVNDTVWFGTNNGYVYRSVDKGLTWTKAATGLADINEVHFANGSYGIAAEYNQTYGNFTLKNTTDGGLTWNTVTPTCTNPNGTFGNSLCYVPGTARTFVNTGADYQMPNMGAAYSTDGGLTWDYLYTDNMTTQFLDVEFVSTTIGWAGSFVNAAGSDSGIFKYTGGPVGLPWNTPDQEIINVFPNPTTGIVNVGINNMMSSELNVNVYDLVGKLVYSSKETEKFFQLDLGSLEKGLYMIEVTSGTKVQKSKIMVQ